MEGGALASFGASRRPVCRGVSMYVARARSTRLGPHARPAAAPSPVVGFVENWAIRPDFVNLPA
jgi:hypothetical protein